MTLQLKYYGKIMVTTVKPWSENVLGYLRNPCSLSRERDTALTASGTPPRDRVLNPYRITPIHWLMARRRL